MSEAPVEAHTAKAPPNADVAGPGRVMRCPFHAPSFLIRLLLAFALCLGGVVAGGPSTARQLAGPTKSAVAWLVPDLAILEVTVVTDRGQRAIAAVATQQRAIFVNGRAVMPGSGAIFGAGMNIGSMFLAPLVALVLLLAWPVAGWQDAGQRAAFGGAALFMIVLADTPPCLAASLMQTMLDLRAPGARVPWPLGTWALFLEGGGRVALALAAAATVIRISSAMPARAYRRALVWSAGSLISLTLAAPPAWAQGPGSRQGASQPAFPAPAMQAWIAGGLRDDFRYGRPVTVIIEFDTVAIDTAAAGRRARLPRGQDDGPASARLADEYQQRKVAVIGPALAARLRTVGEFSHLPLRSVQVPDEAALVELASRPGVKALHREQVFRQQGAQALPLIAQPAAAAVGYSGAGTTVAVIDDGIDFTQAAFGCTAVAAPAACKVAAVPTFVTSGAPSAPTGHGTNVAAIVLSVAPAARVAAINVFNSTGSATSTDVVGGINWAVASRAALNIVAINMSLSDGSRNLSACTTGNPFGPAITTARNAGLHVLAAAGNSAVVSGAFGPGIASPACTPGVLSVGAVYDSPQGGVGWSAGTTTACTDGAVASDAIPCFSQSAGILSLLAPGVFMTAGGNIRSGTSQATPHASGALAVLRAAFPSESRAAIEARLMSNGTPVYDTRLGLSVPRLNVAAAARPANDSFANAFIVSGPNGSASASNRLATLQGGEPTPVPSAGQSVWWQWTAPVTGQVTLDPSSSGLPTYVAVYSGSSLAALASAASSTTAGAPVRWQAQSGAVYRWAASTATAAPGGSIGLGWGVNPAAQADLRLTLSGPSALAPGASANLLASIFNAGPQISTGTQLTVTLPAGVAATGVAPAGCVISGNPLRCAVGDLASGATVNLTFGAVNVGLAATSTLGAGVQGTTPDPVALNNSATLTVTPSASPPGGGGADGDIPTLPHAVVLLAGGWLLWRLRARVDGVPNSAS